MRNAIGLGLRRGWTEFGQSMRSAGNVANYLVLALVFAVVLFFQRDSTIPGTSMLLGTATLPGMLGLMLVFSGLMGSAGALAVEREDGTLLRCKAVPYGMVGYLVGRIVSLSLGCVVGTAVVLVPGVIVVGGLSFGGWATLVWVFVLGLLATLPWGAMIGSLSRSPQAMSGLVALGVGAVTSISGIFYPITALPGWVRGLAQVLPVYWLGHGMRSALLPSPAAEPGGAWHPVQTALVLGVWAVAGLLLAPPVLRRMARRESGAAMQARRDRALSRVG